MDLCKINQGDFHNIITKERNKYLAYFQGEPWGLRNMEINFENKLWWLIENSTINITNH